MKRIHKLVIPGVFVVTVLSLGQSRPQAGPGDPLAAKLEGTWRVAVSLRNCDSMSKTLPPFQSLLTFARGGTLTGTTSSPNFLPGQRSPDYGVWSSAGGHAFRAVQEAFILFDSPSRTNRPAFRSGTQRISQTIELKNDDEFTSTATTVYFDANGTMLTTGCADAVGRRLK
jgi:hypothetical protein